MSQFTPVQNAVAALTQLETLAVGLLLATAVLALVATNTRKVMLARGATWLAIATVTGAVLALLGVSNSGAKANDQPADRSALATVRNVMAFTGNTSGGVKPRGAIIQDCATCPPLVVVPSGWFVMGASANDPHARPQELPARTVRLTRDFAIGQTEVTVQQFESFLLASGHPVPTCWSTNGGGANAAATCVSWTDATAYTRWLKKMTGRTYRLPTAAEWEYAARAGSGQPYPSPGASAVADGVQPVSFDGAAAPLRALPDGVSGTREQNLAVAQGTPNYFGLYDVNGGAAELTQDCWSATLATVSSEGVAAETSATCDRVIKDGMWSEESRRARFSARRSISPDRAIAGVGFRVVRALDHGRN